MNIELIAINAPSMKGRGTIAVFSIKQWSEGSNRVLISLVADVIGCAAAEKELNVDNAPVIEKCEDK